TKLNDLLQPVRQKLEEFKADITQKFSLASNERTELKEQVRLMAELNQQLSRQAESLTRALSSQVKQQGNWGESILETILQHVGLQKDVHYFTQQTATNDDGQTIRPDFVVRYPDDRYVVIDSKVSLVHYQRMLEASEPAEQQTQLNLLVRSVKQHIDGLAGRQYHHIRGSLDYVLLFIPVEGAFITAMQADHQLWKYAHDRKILLLSPTLLLSAMKLIHELWKQDDINRNAALMAERAGKLYDKLAGFLDNFENIGKKLQDATQSFTAAKGQLYTGRGNALSQAQQLKTLGARTSKQIADENPPELPLTEEADTEEE
nr:DNA recombination protein RmuC [Chitinophagaceae bacterium]